MTRWWHIHRDPDWQVKGCYRYDACLCGARRVRLYGYNPYGGISRLEPGWPKLIDRHGRWVGDSGWEPMPLYGWDEAQPDPKPSIAPMDFDG